MPNSVKKQYQRHATADLPSFCSNLNSLDSIRFPAMSLRGARAPDHLSRRRAAIHRSPLAIRRYRALDRCTTAPLAALAISCSGLDRILSMPSCVRKSQRLESRFGASSAGEQPHELKVDETKTG